MKIFLEDRKKMIWLFGILTIAVAGIIYFNFFMRTNESAPIQSTIPGTDVLPVSSAPPASGRQNFGALLPYGDKIDISIFQLDKYTVLKRPPALSVSPEELGKENIFE